jgi:phosphopantetheine adenylyltransferase
MAEEPEPEIDIDELRKSLKNDVETSWKLASESTSSGIRQQFNAALEEIKRTNISIEQFIENEVEHRLNEILNNNDEEE